ncbi:helix-turn-helix domain-containing protein [Streptomyces sp. NPDC048272]|uniref:helix-turn-helix domain-containing protein n=1 Tax=Streptomyces sp. NPDC048272 TaxID=3154616 RepID=UPI0033DBFE66
MAFQHPSAPSRAAYGVQHRNVRLTRRFTIISNDLAQHRTLSLNARGLGAYIQSLPAGTPIGIKDLVRKLPLGEVSIASALRELERHGFLGRSKEHLPNGRLVTHTVSHNHPSAADLAPVAPQAPPPPRPAPPPAPAPDPEPAPDPAPEEPAPEPAPTPEPPVTPEPVPASPARTLPAPLNPDNPARRQLAVEILAELRRADPRLLLGERDVQRLAGTVETWLERGATHQAITAALCANLPDHPRNAAGLVAHRLTVQLPPLLAALPHHPAFVPPDPFTTCETCDRAFRSPTRGGHCKGCEERRARAA